MRRFQVMTEQSELPTRMTTPGAIGRKKLPRGGAASIRAMSVDSVIGTIDIKDRPLYPFIAKIDIEGFEENLFLKNTDWVRQFPVIAIELHDWMLPGEGSSLNFFKTIANGNWDVVFHGELALCISNDFRAPV